jgi:uracil phosphoribosyltransferase
LDADDEYHIEKIERQIKVLRSGMVVTCGLIKNFPNNRVGVKKNLTVLLQMLSQFNIETL